MVFLPLGPWWSLLKFSIYTWLWLVCTWSQGAMCRAPVHPRQVGVWFRIWVGGVLLRIPWMAACVNLRRKGQHRLAFLPPWTHQLLIVSICQADGPLSLVVTRAHTQKLGSSSTVLQFNWGREVYDIKLLWKNTCMLLKWYLFPVFLKICPFAVKN